MRWILATPFLLAPIVLSLGCKRPDLDLSKLRVGMTKKEVVERVGWPSRVSVVNDVEVHEYEAYDRYGAIKVNSRSQFIRFVGDKVEAFGTLEDLKAGRPAPQVLAAAPKAGPAGRQAAGPAASPGAPAFDLKVELEKLEKLKQGGLITEAEYKEFRQKTMDKARALLADDPRVLPEK